MGSCSGSDVEVATTATGTSPTIADEPPCEPGSFDEATELDGFGVVAFVDANVIAMTDDSVQEHMTVLVEDGLIAEIGPAASAGVPEGALEVCVSGHYLMPGLADMPSSTNSSTGASSARSSPLGKINSRCCGSGAKPATASHATCSPGPSSPPQN